MYGKFAHPHKCNELLRPRQRWLRALRLPRAHLERPTPDRGLEDRAAARSTLGALGRVTVPAKSGNVRNISWQTDREHAEEWNNAAGGPRRIRRASSREKVCAYWKI